MTVAYTTSTLTATTQMDNNNTFFFSPFNQDLVRIHDTLPFTQPISLLFNSSSYPVENKHQSLEPLSCQSELLTYLLTHLDQNFHSAWFRQFYEHRMSITDGAVVRQQFPIRGSLIPADFNSYTTHSPISYKTCKLVSIITIYCHIQTQQWLNSSYTVVCLIKLIS